MAIRLRRVDGVWVACCAARSVPKDGDVYLDDGQHAALSDKFFLDFLGESLIAPSVPFLVAPGTVARIVAEEANNPNRTWWDRTYEPNPMLCEHANEVPNICPCDDACYCRVIGNTCSPRLKEKV